MKCICRMIGGNSVFFFVFLFSAFLSFSQTKLPPYFNPAAQQWADSVFNQLSLEEKLGQLFIIEVHADADSAEIKKIAALIIENKVGGLIFFKGGPIRQARLTNYYQSLSKVPLLISIDGEWGLAMRLDSTMRFPRQMTMGAIADESMIYKMGEAVARQCKRMGIHINYAPDIDINNNPLNPIINSRSFGENKEDVSRKGMLYMKAMQDNHILTSAKHFPGHGNTDTDSHLALPIINQSADEMDSVELYPFREAINSGVGSIMVAHLHVPSLDSMDGSTSSISRRIIYNLLKKKMNYQGIVMTDALTMKGVTNFYKPGDLDLRALQAGNDILLMSENVPGTVGLIKAAIDSSQLDTNEVFSSVKKILMVKQWAGLNNYQPVDTINLYHDLRTAADEELNFNLYKNAITLLKNNKKTLPLIDKEEKIASLVINDSLNGNFPQLLKMYTPIECFSMSKDADTLRADSLVNILKSFDKVIVSVHNTTTRANLNFGITPVTNYIIQRLNSKSKTVVCVFGNSYCLTQLPDAAESDAVLLCYEDTYYPQIIIPQVIFGAVNPAGKIPVSPTAQFCRGDGEFFPQITNTLQYDLPEDAGLNSEILTGIDSIALDAISKKAMPGCEVLAAVDGKVVYNKGLGFHTYGNVEPVKKTDLYDIASVTKVAATALATMRLYEKGKIDLNETIAHYLPSFKNSNKQNITLLEMLTHTAGLQAWIPFYKKSLKNDSLNLDFYSPVQGGRYSIKVSDSIYLREDYRDTIWKEIITSPVTEKGKYVYSDLGLLIMQRIIEKLTHKKLDEYVSENFYKPLGLYRSGFKPKERNIPLIEIVPTEQDMDFRKKLIYGDVHDPAAALLGGVAGNAGVFADANSLAIIMQMLLNGGEYGGTRYFKKETIDLFTKQQFEGIRRGIIFDKPEPDKTKSSPTAKSAASSTFGHQGFTGTCVWADPEKKLVYIFLSNRVYPSASNNKLVELNVRTNIMEKIYEAMK